jgi:hypothetical protein
VSHFELAALLWGEDRMKFLVRLFRELLELLLLLAC